MLSKKLFVSILCLAGFASVSLAQSSNQKDSVITIPLGGNAWRVDKDTVGGKITNDGIADWNNPNAEFKAYVRFSKTGTYKLYLNVLVPADGSVKTASDLRKHAHGAVTKSQFIDNLRVADTGYLPITIKGLNLSGNIASIKLTGEGIANQTNYVKNNDGEFFYWGRRGPSVHLNYAVPDGTNAAWFYNEVTVPKGNDVLGSYFMACGFGEGYFGMQVNSPTERHILFSVWSPFNTDDPKKIPDDQKIIMLKKGENVHTGEFGNEGSGGQSYRNYMWKAGNTYRFLVHAKPAGNDRTEYTAYFFAPEIGKWQLIASFSRPKTNTYLKHLHSFLENFDPEQGIFTREVHFDNQWICDSNGKWTELIKAKFTADNTAAKGYRMDYAGGLSGNSFYLKNCGFFNNYTVRNTWFERSAGNKRPDVDLSKLP